MPEADGDAGAGVCGFGVGGVGGAAGEDAESGEEGTQGGKAGACYAEGLFYDGPEDGGGDGVFEVGEVGEVEGPDADDRCDAGAVE